MAMFFFNDPEHIQIPLLAGRIIHCAISNDKKEKLPRPLIYLIVDYTTILFV
jgi:hypothetical protein